MSFTVEERNGGVRKRVGCALPGVVRDTLTPLFSTIPHLCPVRGAAPQAQAGVRRGSMRVWRSASSPLLCHSVHRDLSWGWGPFLRFMSKDDFSLLPYSGQVGIMLFGAPAPQPHRRCCGSLVPGGFRGRCACQSARSDGLSQRGASGSGSGLKAHLACPLRLGGRSHSRISAPGRLCSRLGPFHMS